MIGGAVIPATEGYYAKLANFLDLFRARDIPFVWSRETLALLGDAQQDLHFRYIGEMDIDQWPVLAFLAVDDPLGGGAPWAPRLRELLSYLEPTVVPLGLGRPVSECDPRTWRASVTVAVVNGKWVVARPDEQWVGEVVTVGSCDGEGKL